ncbi:hypothetical protein BG011_009728, partial [Mortierella polycephala]
MSIAKNEDSMLIQNDSKCKAMDDNDSAYMTKTEAKRASKRVPETTAVTTTTSKKRKAIVNHGQDQDDNRNQPIDTDQPGLKRRRKALEQCVPGVRVGLAINLANAMTISTIQKTDINRMGPCAIFPIEVWHLILPYLPVSQVAKTARIT